MEMETVIPGFSCSYIKDFSNNSEMESIQSQKDIYSPKNCESIL